MKRTICRPDLECQRPRELEAALDEPAPQLGSSRICRSAATSASRSSGGRASLLAVGERARTPPTSVATIGVEHASASISTFGHALAQKRRE